MKLICISGLHHLILITFFVDSISEATKKYYETRERGAGAPPPALVPVLSISKTCLLGHPKVTNFYSCNIIFDVIFSVANPFFLQFPSLFKVILKASMVNFASNVSPTHQPTISFV